MAPTLAEQVGRHSKENTTLAQYKYSPECCCKDRVPAEWKEFVEDESLIALNEVLLYVAGSKISNNEVCTQHLIKLAVKL